MFHGNLCSQRKLISFFRLFERKKNLLNFSIVTLFTRFNGIVNIRGAVCNMRAKAISINKKTRKRRTHRAKIDFGAKIKKKNAQQNRRMDGRTNERVCADFRRNVKISKLNHEWNLFTMWIISSFFYFISWTSALARHRSMYIVRCATCSFETQSNIHWNGFHIEGNFICAEDWIVSFNFAKSKNEMKQKITLKM